MNDNMEEDIMKMVNELEEFFNNDALDIIEVEGLNSIKETFENEGFTDTSLVKWKKRKTKDKKGRDKTKYRTNRVGKIGRLNKFGSNNEGRPVLTGHKTGADKLRNSYRAKKLKNGVEFHTDKEYAEIHNEGKDGMEKRQHVGESEILNKAIKKKMDQQLDKIFE
jgi:phage gpG-like protein